MIAKIKKKADYNYLQEEFARRTFDESGDYEVKPFKLDVREHLINGGNRGIFTALDGGSSDKLALGVEPGKAYVQGYEIETQITKFIDADKPRTFNRVVDTPIQTPTGNFVLVKNVTSMPEIDDFEEIHIYDDFIGGSPASIGTCNVRAFQLHDGDYTGTLSDKKFKLGIFDIQMNDGKDFARQARAFGDNATVGSAVFKCDINPKFVALSGTASTADADATVTGVGTLFNSQVQAGDRLFLNEVDVGEVATGHPTNNLTLELTANTTTGAGNVVSGGAVKRMSAELVRPDRKLLVYNTGFFRMRKIRGDGVANPDNVLSSVYIVRRKFTAVAVSSQQLQFTCAGTNESFASSTNLQDFVLTVNTPAGGSARSAGDILDISSSNITLSASDRTVTFTGLNALSSSPMTNGDTVDLIASVKITSTDSAEKSKTLNTNQTVTITTEAAATKTLITLGKADGYALKSVKMAADFSTTPTSSDQDITSRYEFDTGQKDAYYDLAAIRLRPGRPAPSGQILVTFDYFTHGAGDYFSVDSYDGVVDYENIPQYKSEGTGKTFDLRDALDFRPRIDDAGVNFTSSGSSKSELPSFGTTFDADFSYYIGRVDKIVMNFDGALKLVKGVPDINPRPPLDLGKAMTLFEVTYKPYVINTSEVVARKLKNRRYTMKDIGQLETRIRTLEEISALTLLEKATTDLLVEDADGNPRLKNGFIVDNFQGHGIGNVGSPDYRIAVDRKRKLARPMAHSEIVSMVEAVATDAERTSKFYRKHRDGIITLDYSELEFIKNEYASDHMDTNAYKVAAFTGEVELTPASDDWKDTTRRPDLVVVDDNNFDAIQFLADEIGVEGTVWEGWQDQWFGEQIFTGEQRIGTSQQGGWNGVILQETGTQQVGQINVGVETTLVNENVDKALGDRIVDISMIPFMREVPVHIHAEGMKPRTKVNAFFDNVNVNAYIKPDDKLTVTSTNRSDFNFFPLQDPGSYADSDDARTFGTFANPLTNTAQPVAAFAVGDVIKNVAHTATSISNVVQVGNTTTITVASVNGIAVGHIVEFSNIGGSTELNKVGDEFKYFFVESVDTSANTFTIVNADTAASPVSAITAYTSGGTAQRIQASAVVTYQGPDSSDNANGLPIVIHVANRKGGFAVNDTLTGSVDNASGVKNQCTISAVNGISTATSTDIYKNLKKFNDDKITDDDGVFTGVFVIPNTDTVKFRCGDRTLRLIDNVTNNITTGNHSTKAEKIFSATGINETREETILSLRQANFVRDRVQEEREITRNITGSTRFQATSRIQPPPQPDNGDRGDNGGSPGPHDPLAQTFVVSNCLDGVMMTKVDLFFESAGLRPVIIQIVNTKDGFPGQKILAQKIINPVDINVSADASAATTVVFDSPVFMAQDVTYAILIKVDEPGCRVYYSELGGLNLGDNRVVSRNPLTGTMFLSQNGGTWTPHQTRDIKMTIYRASFVSNVSTLEFNNVRNGFTVLQADPFETAPNTNKVRVTQRNHGFTAGDTVVIDNVATGFYGANSTTNGIPQTELNGSHTVVAPVTADTYIIEVTGSNVVGGVSGLSADTVGGNNIQARRNIVADIVQPSITNIRFADTSLTYDMNIANSAGTFTGYLPVPDNGNVYQTERKFVFSIDNQPSLGYSAQLKATMNTLNEFVSPMIDSQRVSLCMVANRVDNLEETDVNMTTHDDRTAVNANTNVAFSNTNSNITTTNATARGLFDTLDIGKFITVSGASNANNNKKYLISDYLNDDTTATVSVTPAPGTNESASNAVTIVQHEKFLDDIAPSGATNLANYVTRRFTLENPCTAIKILYEMNRPNGALMEVYYKVLTDGSEKQFNDIPYTLTATEISDIADENETTFRERTHLVEGLPEFSTIAVKFVFKSTTFCAVPKIKNLRVIALAV